MEDTEIVTKLENHEQRIRTAEKRMDMFEAVQKQIQDLTISVHDLTKSIDGLVVGQTEVNKRLTTIEQVPANRWQEAVRVIIACVITAVASYALTKIGLK